MADIRFLPAWTVPLKRERELEVEKEREEKEKQGFFEKQAEALVSLSRNMQVLAMSMSALVEEVKKIKARSTTATIIKTESDEKTLQEIKSVLEENFPQKNDFIVSEPRATAIADGETQTLSYSVPSGYVYYPFVPRVTFIPGSTYQILKDGEWRVDHGDALQDFGNAGGGIRLGVCKNKLEVKVSNASGSSQTYNCYFWGWLRRIE